MWESEKAMDFVAEVLKFAWACLCLTKNEESGKDCQKDKNVQNLWLRCNVCKQFSIRVSEKSGVSGVAVGEVSSFDDMVLW